MKTRTYILTICNRGENEAIDYVRVYSNSKANARAWWRNRIRDNKNHVCPDCDLVK